MHLPSFVTRHRHYGAMIYICALVGGTVLTWVPIARWASDSAALAMPSLMLVGFMYMQSHRRHLCETCIAELPLDPEKAVTRNRPWLWYAHLLNDTGVRVLVQLTAVLALILVCRLVLHGPVANVGLTVYGIYMVAGMWSTTVHTRLNAWCPWCNDPDDGDEEPAIDPQPVIFA